MADLNQVVPSEVPPSPPALNQAVIEIDEVQRYFGPQRRTRPALDKITLMVDGSTRLGIVGESGSGKSTLTRLMVGLDKPTTGTVRFRGRDLQSFTTGDWRDFRRNVQLIAQDTTSSFDPRRTLRDAVRRPAQELLGLDRSAADVAVDETLRIVGLVPDMADRKPHEVSGGQRQRFSIARALVVKPNVIVCDEVVSALDVSVQGTVLNFLKHYSATNNAGLVFVSHGLPATAFISDEILVMKDGLVVERGETLQVLHLSEQPYTRSLVEAYQAHEHATAETVPQREVAS
jgi:ABC-type glutathione transport system ATPase component